MDDLYLIAEILRPHGRRGEVVLRLWTDHLPTLTNAERVYLGKDPREPVRVLGVRMHKGSPLLRLDGVDSIEKAQNLRGCPVYLPLKDLKPLEEGEFFLHDLVGLALLDHKGGKIGEVKGILETGGPPVLCGDRDGGAPFMVPFAPGTIEDVDMEKGTILLKDLPGLIDD
jgi:16S rRNA processing protein RimM